MGSAVAWIFSPGFLVRGWGGWIVNRVLGTELNGKQCYELVSVPGFINRIGPKAGMALFGDPKQTYLYTEFPGHMGQLALFCR